MGGVCLALYGFIAVSGLKMLQPVDLNENRNLFVVSAILIAGVGGLVLNFGKVHVTSVATALILGIVTNLILKPWKKEKPAAVQSTEAVAASTEENAEDNKETQEEEEEHDKAE